MICFPSGVLLDGHACQSLNCWMHLDSLSCSATDGFPSVTRGDGPSDEMVEADAIEAIESLKVDRFPLCDCCGQ